MECPPEFEELWRHYRLLSETRNWVPGPQPISYKEIDAYNRTMQVHLTLFEKSVIRDIDLRVVPQIGKNLIKKKKENETGTKQPDQFSPSDTGGIKGLFRTMGAIMNEKRGKKSG